jgi:hypothetical protein
MQKRTHVPGYFIACFLFMAWPGGGPATISLTGSTPAAASWSAVVNGKPVSGNTTGGVAPVSLHQDATIDGLSFELGQWAKGPGFQFVIKKGGATQLKKGDITTVCNYKTPEGTLYIVVSATVTLTSIQHRTVGTFSGKWKNAHYGKSPAGAPETLDITDGKFDLP